MVVGRLAPHTILPPNAALSTYPSYYFAASSLASHSSRSYFFPHPPRDCRLGVAWPRVHLHHQPSLTAIMQHQMTLQITSQPLHISCPSSCWSSFIHSHSYHSSSPPHLLSTTPQLSLPNPHLTPTHKPNKSGTDSGTNGRCITINGGKQLRPATAVGRLLVGPQGPPLVAPRGQKWHWSLTCNMQGERYKLVPTEYEGGRWDAGEGSGSCT
jgi:hypothetical protein